MTTYQMLSNAHKDTVRNGGCTVKFAERINLPYIVGIGSIGFTMDAGRFQSYQGRADFIATLEATLEDWRSIADGFGTWNDERGTVYVDPVTFHGTLGTALAVARERGELAIYNQETGSVINV